jgi:catechol 2,3-dioxygenase-like lactoylglutathione lyase family enzyme
VTTSPRRARRQDQTLLGATVPHGFRRAHYFLAHGERLSCADDDWHAGITVVESGQIELESPDGSRLRLQEHDMFCLAALGPVVISSIEPAGAVLALISRRSTSHVGTPHPGPQTADSDPSPQPLGDRPAQPSRDNLMDLKLELVPVPVTDVDRAKAFYTEQVGFAPDVDVRPADGVRVVQLTPPGSACSILLSTGLPDIAGMSPGTVKGLHLVVQDIESSRAELIGRGVEVADIDDVGGGVRYARFEDPDGNSLVLQEMSWRTGDAY